MRSGQIFYYIVKAKPVGKQVKPTPKKKIKTKVLKVSFDIPLLFYRSLKRHSSNLTFVSIYYVSLHFGIPFECPITMIPLDF